MLDNRWQRDRPAVPMRAGEAVHRTLVRMRPQRGLRADVDEIERLCADLVAGVYRADDPPRARLQPRQLPAHAGPAGRGRAVVADQPAGEGGQDRRQGDLANPVIRSHYRHGFIKQYVRYHLLLRTEPATNNVADYGVPKAVE